jgi:hypothetical protein
VLRLTLYGGRTCRRSHIADDRTFFSHLSPDDGLFFGPKALVDTIYDAQITDIDIALQVIASFKALNYVTCKCVENFLR